MNATPVNATRTPADAARTPSQPIWTEPVRHAFCAFPDGRLQVVDFGGSGPPVYLVHGVTGTAWMWSHTVGAIRETHHVYALDLRGHGDSSWRPGGDYSTEQHAEDLAVAMSQLDGAGSVVGLSWGGLVGVHLAATRPELVDRLVVVDAPMGFEESESDVPDRPYVFATLDEVTAWERSMNRQASEELLALFAATSCRPTDDGRWQRKHDPVLRTRWPFRSDQRWEQFAGVSQPLLLVRAAESRVMSAEAAHRMMRERPQTRFREIPESGHLIPLDAPTALGRAVADFLVADDEEEQR